MTAWEQGRRTLRTCTACGRLTAKPVSAEGVCRYCAARELAAGREGEPS